MGPGWLKAYNFSTQFALPELETPRLSALQRCRWPRLRDCKWEGTWLSAGPAWSGPATVDMRWNCRFNVGWTHGKVLLLVVVPNPLKGGGPWMTEKIWLCLLQTPFPKWDRMTDLVRTRNPPPRHVLDKQQLQDNLKIATRSNPSVSVDL